MRAAALAMALAAALAPLPTRSAHPLSTVDAGTVGQGARELELSVRLHRQGGSPGETSAREAAEVAATLTLGLRDDLDLAVAAASTWSRVRQDGRTVSADGGPEDLRLELGWRFLEANGIALAVRPGLTLPSGEASRGRGTGRVGASVVLAATVTSGALALDLDAGYAHRDFSRGEDREANRAGLWRFSLAARARVLPRLQVVAEVAAGSAPERANRAWPATALAGVVASLSEGVDLDLGVETGVAGAGGDPAALFGVTWRW
jgi:Putative MetA-pathway of phenol degradation